MNKIRNFVWNEVFRNLSDYSHKWNVTSTYATNREAGLIFWIGNGWLFYRLFFEDKEIGIPIRTKWRLRGLIRKAREVTSG